MPVLAERGVAPRLPGPARNEPDGALVRRVRDGDELAFEEIDRRYRRRLTAYAAGIVPADRADDVVQEAFVKASTAMTGAEAEIHLRPWLYRIVRNTALNDLRDEPPPHEQLDLEYDGVPQPPDIVARREEVRELTRSIKALPEQQREALVKRELEGRSHDEIATSLGVSAGAVRQLIFRARRGLRESVAAFVPLPLSKLAIAFFAVSGTVATGVAIERDIGDRSRQPSPPPVVAPVAIGPAVSPVTATPRRGNDRDHSNRADEKGDSKGKTAKGAPAGGAASPAPAITPPAPQAVDSVRKTKHSGGSAWDGKNDDGGGESSGATMQLSSQSSGGGKGGEGHGNGQANGHDKDHGSGKDKGGGGGGK